MEAFVWWCLTVRRNLSTWRKLKCTTLWLHTTLHANAGNRTWASLVRGQGFNHWTSRTAPDSNWNKCFTQSQFGKRVKSLAKISRHVEHPQTSLECQEVVNSCPFPCNLSGPLVSLWVSQWPSTDAKTCDFSYQYSETFEGHPLTYVWHSKLLVIYERFIFTVILESNASWILNLINNEL